MDCDPSLRHHGSGGERCEWMQTADDWRNWTIFACRAITDCSLPCLQRVRYGSTVFLC